MIESILNELNIVVSNPQGNGQLLAVCPDCGTKHMYINRTSGLWDCKKGCGQGNLFTLVRKLTGWQDRQCFELLEKHGFGDEARPLPTPKPKDLSWFANELTKADASNIAGLCNVKQISSDSLLKLEPLVHTTEPIVCIPAYNPSSDHICGYLRVGNQGQLVTLKNGKQEKYPAIGEHGLYGLSWLKSQKPDTILFCEAWRDALAAIEAGYFATASSGGASTFKDDWLAVFRDKIVYIVMDADVPGQKAAQRAAEKISSVARSVYIFKLPYEIKEKHGKDLHDYLVIDKGDLAKLLDEAVNCDTIVVDNDQPDTVSEAINEYCRTKLNTIFRYNTIDGWSRYKNGRYRRIENDKELDVLIRRCIRKCVIKENKKQDDGTIKTVLKPLKRKTKAFAVDVKEYWACLDGVYIKPDNKAPSSLDGKLDPAYVLPLRNGLLDFSVYPYKLHPHTEDFYTFNYLDFDWKGEKDSDMWIDFLVDVTCGDAEMFLLLQQWAGYLLKASTEQQKFLLCYGDGANGKSVFFDVMMAMLGKHNCSSVPLAKFGDIHHLTQTYGKMANITDESSKGLQEEVETALKQYTGGTQMTFKRLYNDPFSAYPTAKIMIATNKLPRFIDTSNGIWRRILLVLFKAVIPEQMQDKHLADKIKATEMSGVLKWALEGLRDLEENGRFIEPKSTADALEKYKREMNPLVVFLEENFEATNCEFDRVETKQLRRWYEQWCEDNGFKAKNDINVGIQIGKLWPDVERKQFRKGGDRKRYYSNLKLKNDSEFSYEA